jgi:hypothetical protein
MSILTCSNNKYYGIYGSDSPYRMVTLMEGNQKWDKDTKINFIRSLTHS